MESLRKKDRDKKSHTTTNTPLTDVTPSRKRAPSLLDTNLNKSKQTHSAASCGNNEVASGDPVGRSFSRSSVLVSPSILTEQPRVSSVKHEPAKIAMDISDYVQDTSVWEAMEIRFLDKGKCTVLRPNLSSVLSSAEASVTSQSSAKNSNPSAIVYPRAHLLNAPLPIRRQKVCVEKVHVRNLLNTKREKCGNLSSSRLSEYMPHVSDDAKKRFDSDNGDKKDIFQISKSNSSCVTDTDSFDSVLESNVLRSTVEINLKRVNEPENPDQLTPRSQKCSSVSRSRDSNEGMDTKECSCDNHVYGNSKEGMSSPTDNKKMHHANQLNSSSAIRNPAFAYIKCSNFEQEKGSKSDLAEKWQNQQCSTPLISKYPKSIRQSPSITTNAHNSSTEDEHSSADCCISAEKPTCQTRREFAKNLSFGSAESSFEYVSNKLYPSETHSTAAKRYTSSDKTSDLFTSNISSEAWIKYCTGCFPKDKDEVQENAKQGSATNIKASHQSADRDSTEFSEQATLSGRSKTKTQKMHATWAAHNTPSAVDNYSGASLSSTADKTSLAATSKPKVKGDQSMSIIGAKSSLSSFSPLSEEEIARYKEIALEILMQRKKNQGQGTETKAYRDYSLMSAHRKKRQGSNHLKKFTGIEKPLSTKPASKKTLPNKLEKQRSSSTGRLPRPESVNDRTIFWASQRIRNQIEKHKQRLLQTNNAKKKPGTVGIYSFKTRRTDAKAASTTTSNPSNTDNKDIGNTEGRKKKELKPILSAITSAASLTATSITAIVKHPDKKASLLSLEEENPKYLREQSLPGFKNTLTTGTTTEWSPGRPDRASSVNLESEKRFPSVKVLATETQTGESPGNVLSECKLGGTGPIRSKLLYLDKLDFKDDKLNYAKKSPLSTLRSTQNDCKTNVSYGHCAKQTAPRFPMEDSEATGHGAMQSAQPTRYLDLLHNILKSPTSKTTQALRMFLQKPKALAEAERDLDITVDQIISSYQEIFEDLKNIPTKQTQPCDRTIASSSPKMNFTNYECTARGEDRFPHPVITCSTNSSEKFSKLCCTKYDSANMECHRDTVNPAEFCYDNESREEIKCDIASNMSTPQSCKSSKLNVAIVSGRTISRKFSGASETSSTFRQDSASLHSAMSTSQQQASLPRQHSSLSSLKPNKPSYLDSTNHGFSKASNRKPDSISYNKAQSQMNIQKKNNFKMDMSKRPIKVSSQISSKSNALERSLLEKNNPTTKQTIKSMKKKCVSLTTKGNPVPSGSKSVTGDFCPKYQRDLAKWALEKENNQFELLLQSFQQNLLSSEHETLAMQHTRPAITIIAPQACLNISSSVMPDAKNKETDSEKSTSNKKSFTDTHLLQSVDKRHSIDSFLQNKQAAGTPVVCKTRRIRTFPLCRREIKKKLTTPPPQSKKEEKINVKKEESTEKTIEPPSRKIDYLKKERSLSALSVKNELPKGNSRPATQSVSKPRFVRLNSALTNSEHTIIGAPSKSATSQSSGHKTLANNVNILQLRKSSSAGCTASDNRGHSKNEHSKENWKSAKLTKSDTDNYVVQVISSTKNNIHLGNGPFDLDKSGAVNTLKLKQIRSVSKSQQIRPIFRKMQNKTKVIETKLKNDSTISKLGIKQGERSSPQVITKEAIKSASASSFNERGKSTLIPRRQRASKNQDSLVRKKSLPTAASSRSASCPPGHQGKPKLLNSTTSKEVNKDMVSNTHDNLRTVENCVISTSPNTTNESDEVCEPLECVNTRSVPQKEEDFKKSALKLDERNVSSKVKNETPPKSPTISSSTIGGQDTAHVEYISHHDVKDRVCKAFSAVLEKSDEPQERIEADSTSLDPEAAIMIIAPNDTVEYISSQSNVQIVPSSINNVNEFSGFPLINKRNNDAQLDNRYVTGASEKWQGRPVMSWKQAGSEEDSESEGMSLQAMRRQTVARTCEMIIRESKNNEKNKTELAGDFLAVNKLCNLQRPIEACMGFRTPTKWWPPELLSKTGCLISSLRTDQEHNVGTKSTLSQDTLDSLAPINAETGEEDEESVDFLKSGSSLRMCGKTQMMKDVIPLGLGKYIDSDSTQEDNVRLITTAEDHSDMYSPVLTCEESADKKEIMNSILLNDKLAQGEEPKEGFTTRGLHSLKYNPQFNVNLQPSYFPLIETCDEKIDFFSETPWIESTFSSASCALKIRKSDGVDIEDLSSTGANAVQTGVLFTEKRLLDTALDNNMEVLCELGRQNKPSEAIASKEIMSNIGDSVICLSALFIDDGSVFNSQQQLDKIFGSQEIHEEKYVKREIVEMTATVQGETPSRLHTVDEPQSLRTKSASDTKKSLSDSFSSVLKQERGASVIDAGNSVLFTLDSKSTSIQFESHPLEQTSGEEMNDVIIKDSKNKELVIDMAEEKLEEHLAETNLNTGTQALEKCESLVTVSISSRDYSSIEMTRPPCCLNLPPPEAVNKPSSFFDDDSQQGLITPEDLTLLFHVKTPELLLSVALDTAELFENRTEHEMENALLEIKLDADKYFKDNHCQTGSDLERNRTGVEIKGRADEEEMRNYTTKWTMTSDQESTFERMTPTVDGEKVVSTLEESPSLQAAVSVKVDNVKNVLNDPYLQEPILGDDAAACLQNLRQCPDSLQNNVQNYHPCLKSNSFLDNNAEMKDEHYLSTRVSRKHCTRRAERNVETSLTAPEVKMRIRIELSGDNLCQCNKIKEHSGDNQSGYPCCSSPEIFNPNRDNVQELTLHLGPLPRNTSHKHQQLENYSSDQFEKHHTANETAPIEMHCHLKLPSLESESEIRTPSVEVNGESQQSLIPTPHSSTDDKLYAEDFYDTGLTSKAVSELEEPRSFKIDSFRGLPATIFDQEHLNVFSETENLYFRASRRESTIEGKSVILEDERSQRIFYSGISPERCYRLQYIEEDKHRDTTRRETRASLSKNISGSTNVTNKTTPKRGDEKIYTMDDEKYFVSTTVSPQTRPNISCEALKHLDETKSSIDGFNEEKPQTHSKSPIKIQFSKIAKENFKYIQSPRVDQETLQEPVISSDDRHICHEQIDEPKREMVLCTGECDETVNLKSAEVKQIEVKTKEDGKCVRKLSRNRKINESLIQQKVGENLEMFINSMRELKKRQSLRAPHCKLNSRSCSNPICIKHKSVPGTMWASKSTTMSTKAEICMSASASHMFGPRHPSSPSNERPFSLLKGFQSSFRSPPKTGLTPYEQRKIYHGSNILNSTDSTLKIITPFRPMIDCKNRTIKSSSTEAQSYPTAAPATETLYIKSLVFQSSVGPVKDASTNTNVSVQLLKELDSESDTTDTSHCGFPRALNELSGINELIANESLVYDSKGYEQGKLKSTDYCSMSTQKHESKEELFGFKHEKPHTKSWNPFLKTISPNPFIFSHTEISPTAELVTINSSPQEYCSIKSQNGRINRAHSKACSPLLDLPKVASPKTYNVSDIFEERDRLLITLDDLWLLSCPEKRDDAQKSELRCCSRKELLMALSNSHSMVSINSSTETIGDDEPFITLIPKERDFYTPLLNGSENVSPVLKNGTSYDEHDAFEFPPKQFDTLLPNTSDPEMYDLIKDVNHVEMLGDTEACLAENNNFLENNNLLYLFQNAEFKNEIEPLKSVEPFKNNKTCKQLSGPWKHGHKELQISVSCSEYSAGFKEVSPMLSRSSLCLDDSAEDNESSYLLACSETPLLPRKGCAHGIYSSWISESSVSTPNATRVSSVCGDDESDVASFESKDTQVELFDSIEILTHYLMSTYIKVKEKVKRQYLRKNKTKHKRLHNFGLHASNRFHGMFLPNHVTKKRRFTVRPKQCAPKTSSWKRMPKYNLLKEVTQTTSLESRVDGSHCSFLSTLSDNSKQYNPRCEQFSDPDFPVSLDSPPIGSYQEAFSLVGNKISLSLNKESTGNSDLRKMGKLVEGKRSNEKSPEYVKKSQENKLKHYQSQGEHLRDFSPVSYCVSRELSKNTRDSTRFNEDQGMNVKDCLSQDDNKNSPATLYVVDFNRNEELNWKQSSVESLVLNSHCVDVNQDSNTRRYQEDTKCLHNSVYSEDSVVTKVSPVNNYTILEEDQDKDAILIQRKGDSKNSENILDGEKSPENNFNVGEISPCPEEDKTKKEITFHDDNKTSQTLSHREESDENRFNDGKKSKCIVEDETKIATFVQSDCDKKLSQTILQAEKSPENKFHAEHLFPNYEEDKTRNGIILETQKDIKTSSAISHIEESVEITFHGGKKSCQYENKSSQTMSHIETSDGVKDDLLKNYKCLEEDYEKKDKQHRSQFDDKHCQTILHIEELAAGIIYNAGKNSKDLNEDPEKAAPLFLSDGDIECSHSNPKLTPAENEANGRPNSKCNSEEGNNAYLCCGQNNNKKLQNVFHKPGELASILMNVGKDAEIPKEYHGNSQSQFQLEENNKNSKTVCSHNYSDCSVERKFYPNLVSVDRALSPIAFDNSDAKLDKPSEDVEPSEFIPKEAETSLDDNSGFIFCGGPQNPCMRSLHLLQALFVLLGDAESYPFTPNPDFFDTKDAMPDSLESGLDIKEMVSSVTEKESSEWLKIRTKGYRALQRESKLDKRPVQVVSKDNSHQNISSTQTTSEYLGEAQDVVYQTKMFEQDYDGEIHEVVFFTKDLVGDSAEPENMQEPTVRCKEDGCCADERNSPQTISKFDDNLPVCCHKMVPKQEHQLSPPKRRRPYAATKFGKLISPSSQRKGESSDLSKDKFHTCGTGASYFRSFRENCCSRKRNLKPFSHKQMRLNRLLYTDCMEQKCGSQCPGISPECFLRPSDDKINANNFEGKKEIETQKPAPANVCNRTYSCQGHEEWLYYKNAPIDSTLLSEMQTEFNEKEVSAEGLDKKVVVRSNSLIFFDDYELDTYEELGSLFTEMQDSSSSVLLQDDVDQDEDKCQSGCFETLSNNSTSIKVSEANSTVQCQRKEHNTFCTTCAATQTFLSVHQYLSELTSTTSEEVSEKLPQSNGTERFDQDSATFRERMHIEKKDVHTSSPKHKTTDDIMMYEPILKNCFTQTESQAMSTDLSVAHSESSKYVYFRNVLHKCMQSKSFLRYVQKIVDERLGKKPTAEVHAEVVSTPTFIPVAPKPKPRVGLGHRNGQRDITDQQTRLTEEILEKRRSLTPSPSGINRVADFIKLMDVKMDESSSKRETSFVRMQSSEDESTENSSGDVDENRSVTCNPMSRRKMPSLRRLRKNKDTFVRKKFLSESDAHPISSSSLIIMWSDSTEPPTLKNNKIDTEDVTIASRTSPASCCNEQHIQCSRPSSQSLTSPITCPCKRKAIVCDKACSVVNIVSSQVDSSVQKSKPSLSKKRTKKGKEVNSKPCLSEPNMKFEWEEESTIKRLLTPLVDVKTSESSGTLTTTSIDYGRLKNILSAETKKLWKSLTRLEKNSEKCHVCRIQYNSLLTNSTDRVDFANLADNNVGHEYHVHNTFKAWEHKRIKKQHTNFCQAESSVKSKPNSIDDRSEETVYLTNNPHKAILARELAILEDSGDITKNPHGLESMDDNAAAQVEELKEVVCSTIDTSFKRTSFCTGATRPQAIIEDDNFWNMQRALSLNPNELDTPILREHRDDKCSVSQANISQNIAVDKNSDRCCDHSPSVSTHNGQRYKQHPEACIKNGQVSTQCQTDTESTHSCSPLVVKAASSSLGDSYQRLEQNRPNVTEIKDVKPYKKPSTDSTSHTQSDTADYWIERLMNILHEMHQTFPSTATSSSSNMQSNRPNLLEKRVSGTSQFSGCLNKQIKKDSLIHNTASQNMCVIHERNCVTENSEGKSDPSTHSYVPSPESKTRTSSSKIANEILSHIDSTLSHQESIKKSASLTESSHDKKPGDSDSGFLKINSTGVVSEPLDLRRLPSSTSVASDCHVWDQVKFSTSREDQKQPANDQPSLHTSSFFRHANNHTYFASSTLHYKKYQLRKSGSVPELGHISHLNKSFNAPNFVENDAGNRGSTFPVEISCEMNRASSLIRKTKSETQKEHSIRHKNCSETKLNKIHFKSTVDSQGEHDLDITQTSKRVTGRDSLANILRNSKQEYLQKAAISCHENGSLIKTARSKMLGSTSKRDCACEQSNTGGLYSGKVEEISTGNDEYTVRVSNPSQASVSVRESVVEQKKEAVVNVNVKVEGNRKTLRETRHKRVTSCSSNAKRGTSCSSEKNNDDGKVFQNPRKSASLEDDEKNHEAYRNEEGRESVKENVQVSSAGVNTLVGNCTTRLSATAHQETPADYGLEKCESASAFGATVINEKDNNFFVKKIYDKEEKNKHLRYDMEAINSSFYLKSMAVSRKTQENVESDLKTTHSNDCVTVYKNAPFLCHDSGSDRNPCAGKTEDALKKGAACNSIQSDPCPLAVALQNSSASEFPVTAREKEVILNDESRAVSSCVGKCVIEEEILNCCDDWRLKSYQPAGHDVLWNVNKRDSNDVENGANHGHESGVKNQLNQLIHNNYPNEINQRTSYDKDVKRRTCSDFENVASYHLDNGINIETNQSICNDTINEIRQSFCNGVKNEINPPNRFSGQEETSQCFSVDVKGVSNEEDVPNDVYPFLYKDGQKEVEKLMCSAVKSGFHRHTHNGNEYETCQGVGNEVLINDSEHFPSENNANLRATGSVKIEDGSKTVSGDTDENKSPRATACSVRSAQFVFNETTVEYGVRENVNRESTRVCETEDVHAREAVSYSRRRNRNADLQAESDQGLKTFVQRDKKNLPIWKHWQEGSVKVSEEENEVKRLAVFKNEDGIGSNFFIQNDKKFRRSKYYPNVDSNQLASASPDKTQSAAVLESMFESGAKLLRTPICEVTSETSPALALKSEDSVSSVGILQHTTKSPTTGDQAFLFKVRLKPVGVGSVLWAERGACDPCSHVGHDDTVAKQTSSDSAKQMSSDSAKQLSSDSANQMSSDSAKQMSSDSAKQMSSDSAESVTLQSTAGETGDSQARAARVSPANFGTCLLEDSSVTTVDDLCLKYNIITQTRDDISIRTEKESRSSNSEAEAAPRFLRSSSVPHGQFELEEAYAYEEEGYFPSNGNSTFERFEPLSWEIPDSVEGASMKSEPFEREGENESYKRGAAGHGFHALEIPVDIYTLPVRPTKKDSASHKKKKKKKENSFTRTVVISGPLSNFSIPVHRHISQSEDANHAREDDLSSQKATCSKSCTVSHKSPSCRKKMSLRKESPQRWMSGLRNFLTFRKKGSEKHKQLITK